MQRLEETVAALLGKAAALFVPSGVMGNQVAIELHTRPGDEVVLAERSHVYHYEAGAPAVLSGVQLRPDGDETGILTPADLGGVRGAHDWEPRTRLLCLENTINKAGGRVYPLDALRETAEAALARVEGEGVRVVPFGPATLRATFHRDVDDDAPGRALAALARLYG